MKYPKKGAEIYFVMPPRICIAEWDGSQSLMEAFDDGYVFCSKSKVKKFYKALQVSYRKDVANF